MSWRPCTRRSRLRRSRPSLTRPATSLEQSLARPDSFVLAPEHRFGSRAGGDVGVRILNELLNDASSAGERRSQVDHDAVPIAQARLGLSAFSATPAAANRSCGSTCLLQGGSSVSVKIARGTLSCAQARAIARLYGSDRGTPHEFPARTRDYSTYPGRWRCGALDMGNAACFRGLFGSMKHGMTLSSVRPAREEVLLFLGY